MRTPDQEHEALKELVKWIDEITTGLELPTDTRSMVTCGCLEMTLEIQAAIALLYHSQLYGSMMALLRVLMESTVRGLWINMCATDDELEAFMKGDVKGFQKLIDEIETKMGGTNEVLSNLKKAAWSHFNDFTHTGFLQVKRRHSPGKLEANYPSEELSQSQTLAGALGLVAASVLCGISTKPDLVQTIKGRMLEYSSRS